MGAVPLQSLLLAQDAQHACVHSTPACTQAQQRYGVVVSTNYPPNVVENMFDRQTEMLAGVPLMRCNCRCPVSSSCWGCIWLATPPLTPYPCSEHTKLRETYPWGNSDAQTAPGAVLRAPAEAAPRSGAWNREVPTAASHVCLSIITAQSKGFAWSAEAWRGVSCQLGVIDLLCSTKIA